MKYFWKDSWTYIPEATSEKITGGIPGNNPWGISEGILWDISDGILEKKKHEKLLDEF